MYMIKCYGYGTIKKNYTVYTVLAVHETLNRNFMRVSWNKTPKIPFCDLNICLDFDLRNFITLRKYKETK